jgi:uncharacterized protein YeaO (DUF488 family)
VSATASRASQPDVRTKTVYEQSDPSDGLRVLVTQYWPRGVSRAATDEYLRLLAPARDLLRAFKSDQIDWDAFRQRYLEQVRAPDAQAEIRRLAEEASRRPVTLMCVCREESRCHRSVLQGLVREAASGK